MNTIEKERYVLSILGWSENKIDSYITPTRKEETNVAIISPTVEETPVNTITNIKITANTAIKLIDEHNWTTEDVANYFNITTKEAKMWKSMRMIPDKFKKEWIKLYETKNTIEISKMYNISDHTVYNYLKKNNIDTNQKYKSKNRSMKRKVTNSMKKLMVNMYNEGYSSIEIGKQFNVSNDTVLNNIRHETTIRNSGWYTAQNNTKIHPRTKQSKPLNKIHAKWM